MTLWNFILDLFYISLCFCVPKYRLHYGVLHSSDFHNIEW